MSAGDARILFQDREIVVVHRPGASSHTLVTFADLTFRPTGTSFWGEDAAAKLDLDAIGFVARRENWYPVASVEAALPAVRAALKPQSVAYGYSMGGYGALKHAGRLGIGRAIAVAPQVSIAPTEVPWDQRFHRFHRPLLHPGMGVGADDIAPFTAIVADPYDAVDWRHAGMAAQGGSVHLLRTPMVGHAAIWLLAGSDALAEILAPTLAGDVAAMRDVLRGRRGRSGHWFRLMGRAAFGRGHPRLAETLWERARDLGVTGEAVHAARMDALAERANRLVALGRHPEAIEACRALAEAAGASASATGQAAHLLMAAAAPVEAEPLFRLALGLTPDRADLHLGLSQSLVGQGRLGEALEVARAGHSALPLDSELANHFGHLLNAAGPAHRPEAEAVFRAVLAREPGAGRALLGLSALLSARGEVPEALALAQRAVFRMPGDHDALANLAWLVLRAGDPVRAERLFRRLQQAAPLRAEAYLGGADAFAVQHRMEEAVAVLERGLAKLPEESDLLARLRRLKGLPPDAGTGFMGRLRALLAKGLPRRAQ